MRGLWNVPFALTCSVAHPPAPTGPRAVGGPEEPAGFLVALRAALRHSVGLTVGAAHRAGGRGPGGREPSSPCAGRSASEAAASWLCLPGAGCSLSPSSDRQTDRPTPRRHPTVVCRCPRGMLGPSPPEALRCGRRTPDRVSHPRLERGLRIAPGGRDCPLERCPARAWAWWPLLPRGSGCPVPLPAGSCGANRFYPECSRGRRRRVPAPLGPCVLLAGPVPALSQRPHAVSPTLLSASVGPPGGGLCRLCCPLKWLRLVSGSLLPATQAGGGPNAGAALPDEPLPAAPRTETSLPVVDVPRNWTPDCSAACAASDAGSRRSGPLIFSHTRKQAVKRGRLSGHSRQHCAAVPVTPQSASAPSFLLARRVSSHPCAVLSGAWEARPLGHCRALARPVVAGLPAARAAPAVLARLPVTPTARPAQGGVWAPPPSGAPWAALPGILEPGPRARHFTGGGLLLPVPSRHPA